MAKMPVIPQSCSETYLLRHRKWHARLEVFRPILRTCPSTTPTRSVSEDESRAKCVLAHASGWCCSKQGAVLGQAIRVAMCVGIVASLRHSTLVFLCRSDRTLKWRRSTKSFSTSTQVLEHLYESPPVCDRVVSDGLRAFQNLGRIIHEEPRISRIRTNQKSLENGHTTASC